MARRAGVVVCRQDGSGATAGRPLRVTRSRLSAALAADLARMVGRRHASPPSICDGDWRQLRRSGR